MAYTAGNLHCDAGGPPGRREYVYNTTDTLVTVEAAGYLNNKDDNLNLQKGDRIKVIEWATAVDTGTINKVGDYIVTNVIPNDAAASAGAVNIAEYGVSTAGALSSLA